MMNFPQEDRVDQIQIDPSRRPLDEDMVITLMESIQRLGLQTPIAVVFRPGEDDPEEMWPHLVAGRHRLEACRRLGWQKIPIIEFKNEADARLWEISENSTARS